MSASEQHDNEPQSPSSRNNNISSESEESGFRTVN